nr:hypothetical protein KK1_013965 [Ipomoea batatas]
MLGEKKAMGVPVKEMGGTRRLLLISFSSASLRNLSLGGGEDLILFKAASVEDSKRGLNPWSWLKLLVLEPFLDFPSSDSKSSLVSSLIVNRNLGGPHRLCSLISSDSTPSSSPNPFNNESFPVPTSKSWLYPFNSEVVRAWVLVLVTTELDFLQQNKDAKSRARVKPFDLFLFSASISSNASKPGFAGTQLPIWKSFSSGIQLPIPDYPFHTLKRLKSVPFPFPSTLYDFRTFPQIV